MKNRLLSIFSSDAGLIIVVAIFGVVLAGSYVETKGGSNAGGGSLTSSAARELLSHVAGFVLKKSAVRVKEINELGSSAVVVADIEAVFRFQQDDGKWRVAEIRTGDRTWQSIDFLAQAVAKEKMARAQAELQAIATALAAFRRDRGVYVTASSEAGLMDALSPRYLARIIQLDPWERAYHYKGTSEGFELRCDGPDGVSGTSDDLILSGGLDRP